MDRAQADAAYLTRVGGYAANILAAERASRRTMTRAQRDRALGWYRSERAGLESLAWDVREERGLQIGDLRAETVVAVAATLSPATSWGALLADLPGFIAAALDGEPVPPFATYGAQRAKAARLIREWRGVESVTGPKVAAFARALNGDPLSVVVDRHAARIATGDDSVVRVGRATLRAIQGAYTVAAARVGVDPAALQALVWVARVGFHGENGGADA